MSLDPDAYDDLAEAAAQFRHSLEMDDRPIALRQHSRQQLLTKKIDDEPASSLGPRGRHTLGLFLLLCVVFLWTMSNFLGSSIFADNTYAKPFFLTYFNTSMFMLSLIPALGRSGYKRYKQGTLYTSIRTFFRSRKYRKLYEDSSDVLDRRTLEGRHLDILSTARLSLTFCLLWFCANYFAMACLKHTTVASTTVLTSTSSIWTLLIGSLTGTERFTYRKLLGVLFSILGIILISRSDLSSSPPQASDPTISSSSSTTLRHPTSVSSTSDPPLSKFPTKSPRELLLGDALALLSAIIYGLYTITLKRTTTSASPRTLNMPLFFGLVGLFNAILLCPLFPILHYTGYEPFSLPPTRRIWTILLVNSVGSLVSDLLWAYAMVLTSPLVVTVGLSLTIPLSLVGEMVLQGRHEGWGYWVGAGVVVGSFVFVDQEERVDEVHPGDAGGHGTRSVSSDDEVEGEGMEREGSLRD